MPHILIQNIQINIINIIIMEELVMITDPFEVLDCLGGAPSGSYSKDLEIAQQFRRTFSVQTYEEAMQMLEQP